MKAKDVLSAILVVFVVVAVVYSIARESAERVGNPEPPARRILPPTDATEGNEITPIGPQEAPALPLSETIAPVKATPVVGDASMVTELPQAPPKAEKHVVIAYYFHGTVRCATCEKFEEYTREALEKGFPVELKNGALEWRVLNVDEPQNKHFVQDYQLTTRSVVLVDVLDGQEKRRKNLTAIWNLVGNRDAFLGYIQSETLSYLEAS
jgi:hypothetical protein